MRSYNLRMSYVEENLISGEQICYRANLHWMALVRYSLGALALIGGGIALVVFGSITDALWVTVAGGIFLGLGFIVAVVGKMMRSSAEFAVTNKRVILKTGIIQRRTTEMFLSKIETVGVDQGLVARMLDYGTISLRGTGGTSEPFSDIADPLEFRRQVQEQMSHMLNLPAVQAAQAEG